MSEPNPNKVRLTIDGINVEVDKGTSVLNAAKAAGVEIPHFCYHNRLSVAGNCRMCLVDIEKSPKPVASCAMPAGEGMVVSTQSNRTVDARKGVMEMLLINHPLDCPICDQGGECDLQDIAVAYGSDRSRYEETKRAVVDKNIGPLIKTVMTRCIHCTRCIRFATEVAGVEEMGATGRGENMSVGTYVAQALESELSGNMVDLCPVGALTSKPYAFVARPWELVRTESVDVMDALGSRIRVDHREGKVMRIVPEECDAINEEWLSDAARYSYDGLARQRLTSPMLRRHGKLEETSWPEAFNELKTKLAGVDADKIAGLAGELQAAEDLYAFRTFMQDVLGSDNLDARPLGMHLKREDRSAAIFNSTIAGIDEADAILLVGANTRHEAPVLNARIRKAVRQRRVPVGFIGADIDLTYDVANLGRDVSALEDLISGKSAFAEKLKNAKNPLIIVGGKAVLTRADSAQVQYLLGEVVKTYNVVNQDWNGYNVLHQRPGAVAALDVAAYPQGKGKDGRAILKALKDGKVDVLVLYGEADAAPAELKGAKTTIFIGTHHSAWSELADVVLPAAAYTEKNAWWTNTEGRVQEGKAAVRPPLHAKEDWKIFRALSDVFGKTLPFDTQQQLRNLIVKTAGAAYEQVGKVVPATWQGSLGAAGKASDEAFAQPVEHYYLSNAVLRASAVMAECQELANARIEKIKKAG